jgi:DnaK suppressor protein
VKQRKEFLDRVKKKLLERREEMMKDLSTLSTEKVSDGQVQDTGDEALSLTMEKLQTSLEQADIDELRLIDDALSRISRGEYGLCIDCGQQISSLRLETFPYAARCIVCQEALEGV